MRKIKVYIAGPDIFRKDATEFCQWQKEVCRKYGFIPIHPIDLEGVNLKEGDRNTAKKIYWKDCSQIDRSHLTVANCNYFRGGCMDDGTAYEIGYTHGQGKIVYGYIENLERANLQIPRYYPCHLKGKILMDKDGFVLVDDFGTALNLMIQEGIEERGGRFIQGNFEDAISKLHQDFKEGILKLIGNKVVKIK